eukprot:TRINITY_DN13946_c0_g4_i1.p1 TRINITY_DN13946_c0_g4~~TRINITY_DN13946_c0_g4_i1.p1  ORF type:complete len:351 (-),score=52.93 TRINITY_DN13946_c0_g4_i1:74-1126(-)
MEASESSNEAEQLDEFEVIERSEDQEKCVEAVGAARAMAISWLRGGYTMMLQMFSRWAAAPHRLFRPENPTLGRLEDAIDIARRGQEQGKQALPSNRGLYSLWTTFGWRQAFWLKCRSVAVNGAMGTVMFTTYDHLRGRRFYHLDDDKAAAARLTQVALAASIAGTLHGSICAPLEIAAHRLQAFQAPLTAKLLPEIMAAMRRPLPYSKPGDMPGLLTGSILPLSATRDGLGIASFFLTFECMQVLLHGKICMTADEGHWLKAVENSIGTLTAGGCAGIAYRLTSWHSDLLLRTRLEAWEGGRHMDTVRHHFAKLVQEHGLWRTFVPPARTLASAFPSSALGLLVYEWLR